MTQINLLLDPGVARFYLQIAQATGYPLEKVISDALFKLAGELSLEALEIIHRNPSDFSENPL